MATTYQYNWIRTLVRHATGDEYGDGMRITSYGTGYAEPGYHDSETPWVLGNWNDTQPYADYAAGLPKTAEQVVMPRVADILTAIGVEIEWLDEWYQCTDCWRIVRNTADSYSWTASYVMTDGQIACHDCIRPHLEDFLADSDDWSDDGFINRPKAITFCDKSAVEALGFVQWEPGDPQTYESGWHPGQTDDPTAILAAIHELHPAAEVVFFLDEASQFYVRFSALVRHPATEEAAA